MKADYYRYKPLRNQIRKYDAESIILRCIKKLHELCKRPVYEETGYLPWELMFLIKFVALDGDGSKGLKPDAKTLPRLLNKIKNNIGNSTKFINQGDSSGLNKFMRRTAFQQFGYQLELNKADFGRQIFLFQNLKWKYPLKGKFEEVTRVPIEEFFEISFALWSILGQEEVQVFVDKPMLSPLYQIYGDEVLESYLDKLSLNIRELKKFISEDFNKCGDIEQQYFEQTPLKAYPLLRKGGRYYCYSPYVLNQKIKNCVYDTLKAHDSVGFSNEFGYKFEEYINECLKSTDEKYIPESELKERVPNSKVVDFVLPYDDCTVLMEVKAIELSPDARVNPTNLILSNRLETSIVKSFKQIYSFAKTLKDNPKTFPHVNPTEIFALIVTYKELYLGRGSEAWDEFIFESVRGFLEEKEIDPSILPPSKIYFLSVEAFERLIGVLNTGELTLPEILRRAVRDDDDPLTSKYLFEMHLKEEEYKIVPFVEDLYDEYITGIMKKYKDI